MNIPSIARLLASLSFFACTSLFASQLVVDVTGIPSYGELGNPNNTVLTYNVGANAVITSIRYDVNLTAYYLSFLSDISLNFVRSNGKGVAFAPAAGDDFGGTASYSNTLDLVALGFTVQILDDGIFRLEFYESGDDLPGPDGVWNFGTITFGINGDDGTAVPEPGTTALFGAGLMLMAYVARRRSTRA
ncbi:MAG: PEP-CTERM sorting domain-containing protein [Pseudomonadota bacterium]|nr:PEP-CTERM sorting domain-containing protein [Pseudomonadota bacterium]